MIGLCMRGLPATIKAHSWIVRLVRQLSLSGDFTSLRLLFAFLRDDECYGDVTPTGWTHVQCRNHRHLSLVAIQAQASNLEVRMPSKKEVLYAASLMV